MVASMFNTITGKRIALFGVAFKANTSDTRESAAFSVCKDLLEERAHVVVTDPYALNNFKADLKEAAQSVEFEGDPYIAAQESHAIAILTEWPQYTELDFKKIYASMTHPAFIFDGRNILDHEMLYDIGFNVLAVGKPSRIHFSN
jgi:UDPglucose 6-dehydrogenase